MVPTIIQIFVTEQAAPISVTHTLPGFSASAMITPRKRLTLIAQITLPAVMTLALSGQITGAVVQVTPLLTHRLSALCSSPALLTDLDT